MIISDRILAQSKETSLLSVLSWETNSQEMLKVS
jgi:hypothetical protein